MIEIEIGQQKKALKAEARRQLVSSSDIRTFTATLLQSPDKKAMSGTHEASDEVHCRTRIANPETRIMEY